MPVNMPTHAHGQGGPLFRSQFHDPGAGVAVSYKKGPYFAEEAISPRPAPPTSIIHRRCPGIASLGLGSNGYGRAMAANSYDAGPGHLLYGFELFHNDGPWVNPEDYAS